MSVPFTSALTQDLEDFEEEEADHIVRRYTSLNPERGERMIQGDLRSRSRMLFTRQQLRDTIHRVDEDGVVARGEFLNRRIIR